MDRRAVLILTLLLSLPLAAQFQGPREKLDAYRASQQRVEDAIIAGNTEAAQQEAQQQGQLLSEARSQFEELNVLRRGSPEEIAAYADVLAAQGDFDLAAEALKDAVRQAPAVGRNWVYLGQYLAQIGPSTIPESFEVLLRAVKMNLEPEEAAEALFTLGKLYHKQGLVDFATDHYQQALEKTPDHVYATIALAALRAQRGEVAEASRMLDGLGRAAQPYDAETRIMLRHALFNFTEYGQPFEDTFDNHLAYCRLLYRAARLPEATLAGQRAVVLNPQSFETLNFLATIYFQSGNAANAREALERSLAINPNQPDVVEGLKNLPPAEPAPQAAAPAMLQRPAEAPAAAPQPEQTPQAPEQPVQPQPEPQSPEQPAQPLEAPIAAPEAAAPVPAAPVESPVPDAQPPEGVPETVPQAPQP